MKQFSGLLFLVAVLVSPPARAAGDGPGSPWDAASALERRIAGGDGVTLPDAEAEILHYAGTVDLSRGNWPAAFAARAGETVFVSVSPFTGCYEFFDESGSVFWTVVPVFPTTDNWVAPFRHAEPGPTPDDGLYAPWRLVDVWLLSRAESAEFESRAENAGGSETAASRPRLRDAAGPDSVVSDLCFTVFYLDSTNLFFTASWPTNEALPENVLDLYGSTNLSSDVWTFLSSHPATNPPAEFAIGFADIPWHVAPTQHVHDATCVSVTNVVVSPLDGITAYTNVFWSCSTNRVPADVGFFRLGTRFDGDGDGLFDAFERLCCGTSDNAFDTDGDNLPDAWEVSVGLDPLDPTGDNGRSGDPDGDGRTNRQEWQAGTAPLLVDTDGDGVPDGVGAYSWSHHSLQPTESRPANLVVEAAASVPAGASAAFRLGTLTMPLTNGTHLLLFRLAAGQTYPFRFRTTGGAGVAARIVPPGEGDGPCSDLPGFTLNDPQGGFSQGRSANAAGDMSFPSLSLRSVENLGTCVHEIPGKRSWIPRATPGSWSDYATRFSVEGFETEGNGNVSLVVADSPRSVATGLVSVASTEPGFPPAAVSAEIHRCEYDLIRQICGLCGERHDTGGLALGIVADYRYALFGSTNMCGFRAVGDPSLVTNVNWTVSPAPADGACLHDAPDFLSPVGTTLENARNVWIFAGFSTNDYTVTASYAFAPDVSATKPFTAVAVDAEAICAEIDSAGFVVNPVSIPIGETATFRVKVFPSSVPNNRIVWRIDGEGTNCAAFVGGRTGREVTLRGVARGDVDLKVEISGYNGLVPTFRTTVMPLWDVPVAVWIVRDNAGNNAATTESHIRTMVDEANLLLRQVCISCYVHQVFYTNKSEWLDLEVFGTTNFNEKFDEIVSVPNPASGMEVHFVHSIGNAVGANNLHGMVLAANATSETFAHETGHAFGLKDVYAWHGDTSLTVVGDVHYEWSQFDWCGDEERGFYPDFDSLSQSNLVRRLIMHGIGTPGRDFSWGDVYGIRHPVSAPTSFEHGYAGVGVFPGFNPPWPHHD